MVAMKPVHRWRSWDDAPHVLSNRQVSDLFNLSFDTLNEIVSAGLLRRSQVAKGRHYRYPKPEVQRFAHRQQLDPFPDSNPFRAQTGCDITRHNAT